MRVLKSFEAPRGASAPVFRAFWLAAAFALALAGLVSCAEDDGADPDDGDPQYSPEVMALTGGELKEWRIESLKKDGEAAELQACDLDNRYIFEPDSSFAFRDGGARCADELPAFSGAWAFQNNGRFIFAEGENESKLFEVEELTDARLVWIFNTAEGEREETLIPARIP